MMGYTPIHAPRTRRRVLYETGVWLFYALRRLVIVALLSGLVFSLA